MLIGVPKEIKVQEFRVGSVTGSSRIQVGSFAEQNFRDVGVAGGRRTYQRRPAILRFGVGVSTLIKQDASCFRVTAIGRNQQSRLAILASSIRISTFGQQSFNGIGAAGGRGLDQF